MRRPYRYLRSVKMSEVVSNRVNDTILQEFSEAIAQPMRCKVSYIALDELEAKLSMRGMKKTNLDQTWKIYAGKLIEAIFQNNANVDIEVHYLFIILLLESQRWALVPAFTIETLAWSGVILQQAPYRV